MTVSVRAGGMAPPGPPTLPSSIAKRMFGVVRRPRRTFEGLVAAPRWVDVLIVTTAAAALAGALVMWTDVGQQALADQWERTAIAFGRTVDDAAYARLQELSSQAAGYEVLMALVNGPGLTLVVATALFVLFRRVRRAVTFRQVLAVAAHAGVILALRQVIAAPATYLRETTASATSLGLWFPGLDEAAPLARFLGALDLLVLWWAVVLGVGVAVLYRVPARRSVSGVLAVYVGLVLLLTVAMVAAGGT